MSGHWLMAATAAILTSRVIGVAVRDNKSPDDTYTNTVMPEDKAPPPTRQQRRAMERRLRKTGGDR